MKKITIDASSILPIPGKRMNGITRTTLELVRTLSSMKLPFELQLFTQRLRGERLDGYHFGLPVYHLPLPRWDSVAILTKNFPIIETICHSDIYHIPHNYAPYCRLDQVVLTIHDTMFFSYPEEHLGTEALVKTVPPFAKQCKAVITISEHSKKDIVKYMGVDPDKIFVINWGIDHSVFCPTENLRTIRERISDKFNLNKPFFFSVSCDIGRKNTPKLIDEYLRFASENPINDLVLIWGNPPKEVLIQIDNSFYADRIHIIKSVSDEDLRDMYRISTALVFPSLYEGFGLPVLEAMACGTAVITTPFSSLSEVGGDAAYYINPNEKDTIYNALRVFENNDIDRTELIQKGLAHAKQFTWEKCAQKTVDVYMKLLDE